MNRVLLTEDQANALMMLEAEKQKAIAIVKRIQRSIVAVTTGFVKQAGYDAQDEYSLEKSDGQFYICFGQEREKEDVS